MRKRQEAEQRGRRGEAFCLWWLRLQGWRIIARRFIVGRGSGAGEVDLIAKRGGLLIFVEVKARATPEEAAYAITLRQQARITRGAEAFLAARPELAHLDMRFDAMLVAPGHLPVHIKDAWRRME